MRHALLAAIALAALLVDGACAQGTVTPGDLPAATLPAPATPSALPPTPTVAPLEPAVAAPHAPPPAVVACPTGVPVGARCLAGRDVAGAYYWIAVPAQWNNILVLHAHGGPELGPPHAERTAQDLQRWSIMVKAGYAWAGSTYRQGGVAVRAAAEDTERLRAIFVTSVGKPRLTVLHGQSWGGNVAAKAAEMFPASWDGVLLTSGVLAGGTHAYDFRLDLRVVYQAVCGNHPLPSEPQYPLWQGLPPGSALTRAELARRVDDCTGVRHKPAERSAAQQQNLATLAKVVRIPERTLISHLDWATWDFQDIVYKRLDGGNPFGNIDAHYAGSPDDNALNRQVARYAADPAAVTRFAQDSDLTGQIRVPVLTAHAIDDPTAFVEMESAFLATMKAAGTSDHLVQTFTDEHEHSYLSDAEYPALMQALVAWVSGGEKPTPDGIAEHCTALLPNYGGACHFMPGYRPGPLTSRVTPRVR